MHRRVPYSDICMAARENLVASELLIMRYDSEQRVRDLCLKVMAVEQDSPEFAPAIDELQFAIREHLDGLRDQVAELAFVLAAESEAAHVN